MKKLIILSLIALSVNIAFAQDFFDALKFSQTEYGGTARSIAMGSAFGALGGDFVSASINPAGLGFYRAGEFALSPTLNLNQAESNYLNNNSSNDRYNFNFNNISYVGTLNTGVETGIVSVTFGVGYNRLKNFNSNINIQGYGAKTTLLNYYTDYANQIQNPNSFDYHYEGLAWNTYLIDEDQNLEVIEGVFYNDLTDYNSYEIYDQNNNYLGLGYEATGVKSHQNKSIINRGGHIDEYLASMGMNINHKVYIGASIGLVDLEYNENILYSEIDDENVSDYFKNFTLNSSKSESGMGFNFKTGVIVRPFKSLRIGASIHTPTFYDISFDEDKTMTANYDQEIDGSTVKSDDNNQYYAYKFESPLKADFSIAYTLGDRALISADYELVNYGNTKFRNSEYDTYDYSDKNSEISKTLKTTGNIRIGGEYRVTPNVSVRAGYNFIGNPWQSTYTFSDGSTADIENKNDSFSNYSAGIGYRQKSFFIDFAYRLGTNNYSYKVHELYYTNPDGASNLATVKEMNNQATITMGFRF